MTRISLTFHGAVLPAPSPSVSVYASSILLSHHVCITRTTLGLAYPGISVCEGTIRKEILELSKESLNRVDVLVASKDSPAVLPVFQHEVHDSWTWGHEPTSDENSGQCSAYGRVKKQDTVLKNHAPIEPCQLERQMEFQIVSRCLVDFVAQGQY